MLTCEKKPITLDDILNHPDLKNIIFWCMKKIRVPLEEEDEVTQNTVLSLIKRGIRSDLTITSNIYRHTQWVYWSSKSKIVLARKSRITTGCEKTPDKIIIDNGQKAVDDREWYVKKVSTLSSFYQKIIKMRFVERLSLQEIGNKLNMTRSAVQQIETKILKKLKESYEKDKRDADTPI